MKRLSAEARAELERRLEALRLELRLVEAELRSDEALRVQAEARERAPDEGRGRLSGGWRGPLSMGARGLRRGQPLGLRRRNTIIGLIEAAEEDGAGYCDVALPHLLFSTTGRRAYAIGSLPKDRFGQTPRHGDTSRLSPDTTQPW